MILVLLIVLFLVCLVLVVVVYLLTRPKPLCVYKHISQSQCSSNNIKYVTLSPETTGECLSASVAVPCDFVLPANSVNSAT